jgi:hypothetical protein
MEAIRAIHLIRYMDACKTLTLTGYSNSFLWAGIQDGQRTLTVNQLDDVVRGFDSLPAHWRLCSLS